MKDLQQNIERMEKELAEMKAKLEESKRFKWEYPKTETYYINEQVYPRFDGDRIVSINHGRYRLSKEYAEHSLERNRVANRLEALVEQIEPDYVVPEMAERAYFVYIGIREDYVLASHASSRVIGQVYMSKKTATTICELLNSGEVVL